MLGRSVTFRPESIEKHSQRGTLKNLTTPNKGTLTLEFVIHLNSRSVLLNKCIHHINIELRKHTS